MKCYTYFRYTRTLGPTSVPSQNVGLVAPTHGAALTLKMANPSLFFWTGICVYTMTIVRPTLPAGGQNLRFDQLQVGMANYLSLNSAFVQTTEVATFRMLFASDSNLWANGFRVQMASPTPRPEFLVWYYAGFADGDALVLDGYLEFDQVEKGQDGAGGAVIPPDNIIGRRKSRK